MNWNDLTKRQFSSVTTGTKDDDFWKVIIEMTEMVELHDTILEPRKISAMGIDMDFNDAFEVATKALFSKFMDETKGTGTLYPELAIEHDDTKDNKTTEPQSISN